MFRKHCTCFCLIRCVDKLLWNHCKSKFCLKVDRRILERTIFRRAVAATARWVPAPSASASGWRRPPLEAAVRPHPRWACGDHWAWVAAATWAVPAPWCQLRPVTKAHRWLHCRPVRRWARWPPTVTRRTAIVAVARLPPSTCASPRRRRRGTLPSSCSINPRCALLLTLGEKRIFEREIMCTFWFSLPG